MKLEKKICAPSILSADFTEMDREIKKAETAGAQWLHLDVMDGQFVPEITFGSKMVKDIRNKTDLFLDVHLMVNNPENMIKPMAAAGANSITFHAEAVVHMHRYLQMIKSEGVKCGVSLVPSTPISFIEEVLNEIDLVLIMSVNPGYGGQTLIPSTMEKIKKLARIREEKGMSFKISVDGGVNRSTVKSVKDAGVDVFVAGSAFFGSENPTEELKLLESL